MDLSQDVKEIFETTDDETSDQEAMEIIAEALLLHSRLKP